MPTIQEIIGGKQIANQYRQRKPKTVMEQIISTPPAVPVQSMAKPVAPATAPLTAPAVPPPVIGQPPPGTVPPSVISQPPPDVVAPPVVGQPTVSSVAGPGPSQPPMQPETTPVDPTTEGQTKPPALTEQWETDPILGRGPISVEYDVISDPGVKHFYINKETGERVEYTPDAGSGQGVRIYKAPDFLDPVSRGEWDVLSKELQDVLSGVKDNPFLQMKSERGGGIGRPEIESAFKQYVDYVQKRQRELIQHQWESTNPPYSGEGAGPVGGQPDPNDPKYRATTDGSGTLGTAQGALGDNPPPPSLPTAPKTQTLNEWLTENPDPTQHPGGVVGWQQERNKIRDAEKANALPETKEPVKEMSPDDFKLKNPDPTQYPGGVTEWQKELRRLQAVKAATPQTEITPNQGIDSNKDVEDFLGNLLKNAGELSPEEEATIRRAVQAGGAKALSALSARGLGRGSESLGVITQTAIAEEDAVGVAKREAREKGTQNALRAAEMLQANTSADRNYQLAQAGQNLEALKNSQNQSLQDRLMDFRKMEFTEGKRRWENEFGLAISEEGFRQWLETGKLELAAIDMDQTNQFRNQKMANDFLLTAREQDIQQHLGIAKLDMERWIAGENIGVEKMSVAIQRALGLAGIEIEKAKIMAMMEMAESDDGIGFGDIINWAFTGVKLYLASQGKPT